MRRARRDLPDGPHRPPKPGRRAFFWLVVFSSQLIFFFSPFFAVRQVVVSGNQRVSREEILHGADVVPGSHILLLDPASVARRILDGEPRLREVRVRRKLPRSVELEVRERTHYLSLLSGETLWAVDEQGVVLYELEDPSAAKKPVVTLEGRTVTPGVRETGMQMQVALQALPAVRDRLRDQEVALIVDPKGQLTLELDPPLLVKLGELKDPKELEEKLTILPTVFKTASRVAEEKKGEIEYIDFRFKDTPFLKFKGETADGKLK